MEASCVPLLLLNVVRMHSSTSTNTHKAIWCLLIICACRRVAQHEELLWTYEDGSGSYFATQVANMRQRLVLQAGEQASQVCFKTADCCSTVVVLLVAALISVQESRLARCAVELLDVFVVPFASVFLSVVP
jgi:hypothetical protein